MKRPRICAVITENDYDLAAGVDRFVDLYEIRIDLIGDGWQEWANRLQRPWIACNRLPEEGGRWSGTEEERIGKLLQAARIGARIVDLELRTNNLPELIREIKNYKAEVLLSFHNLHETPDQKVLEGIIKEQLSMGADICKVVTTARRFEDNITVLRLIGMFPDKKVVAFAMGEDGIVSRVISPMIGGYFTYGSITQGRESAPGQLMVTYMRSLYEAVRRNND